MDIVQASLARVGLESIVVPGMVIQVLVIRHKVDGNGNTRRWMKILAPIVKDGRITCVDITWKVALMLGNTCRTSKTGMRAMATSNTPEEIVARLSTVMYANSTLLSTQTHS